MDSPDMSKAPIHKAKIGNVAPSGVIADDTAEQTFPPLPGSVRSQ